MSNEPINVTCTMCQTPTPEAKCEFGAALGHVGPFCSDCQSWLTDYEFEILSDTETAIAREIMAEGPSLDPWDDGTNTHTFMNSGYVGDTFGPKTFLPKCTHHLTPYTLPQGRVYLSGYSALLQKARRQGPLPNVGVYLSSDWLIGQAAGPPEFQEMKSLYVGWPDFGAIGLDLLTKVALWTQTQIEDGGKVEIACYGGHGRTGTLVAALAIISGKTAKEAIFDLRRDYCYLSIEGVMQENLLYDLEDALNAEHTVLQEDSGE